MALCRGEIQLGILKKLSGTAIDRHDQSHGMRYSPWPPYELLQNDLLPFSRLQELKRMARYWDLIYNSGNFRSSASLLWPDGDVFHGFFAFSRWLFAQTRATWKIALPRLAELLFRYLVDRCGAAPREVADRLARDLLTVRGRVLPPAIREWVRDMPERQYALRPLSRRQDRHRENQGQG